MESGQDGAGAGGWANGPLHNGRISTGAAPFHASNGIRLDPLQQRGSDRLNGRTGDCSAQDDTQDTTSSEVRLIPPRRSLFARLRELPAGAALGNWVSSIVNTASRYRRWLPWQVFSDELRQLVLLLTEKPMPMDAAGGDDRGMCGQVAIVAAVFAVCELLLAWDAGQVRKVLLQPYFFRSSCMPTS